MKYDTIKALEDAFSEACAAVFQAQTFPGETVSAEQMKHFALLKARQAKAEALYMIASYQEKLEAAEIAVCNATLELVEF